MKGEITDKLAAMPLNYAEERAFIESQSQAGSPYVETSILLLLSPWDNPGKTQENWSFLLNKRSEKVPQPGDLCFPGGHLRPVMDRITARALVPHVFPMAYGKGLLKAGKRDRETFTALTLFLAGAIRECWEETRISPFSLDFLGPVPAYRMLTRRKIIYPLVACLRKPVIPRTTPEIEKNIFAPFDEFFKKENYGTVTWTITGKFKEKYSMDKAAFPCFLVRQPDADEILWGATLNICLSFLKAVFDFSPPDQGPVSVSAPLYPSRA